MYDEHTRNKIDAWLKLGMTRPFQEWAWKQPCQFSGNFYSEEEAQAAMEKLTRKRTSGQIFWIEPKPDGWCIMARNTGDCPPPWQDLIR